MMAFFQNYVGEMLGLTKQMQIDVRLQGKRSGFNYETSMWPNIDKEGIEKLMDEVICTCSDLEYTDTDTVLDITSLFIYVERAKSGEDVLRLNRLEDTATLDGISCIRVQQWSDWQCDGNLADGTLPTITRLHKLVS
jgi:hypothetical protein